MRTSDKENPPIVSNLFHGAHRLHIKRVLCFSFGVLLLMSAGAVRAIAAEVPVVRADLGPCTAHFTVTDSASKPLYNAKIQVVIRHGFLSKRKLELEIGTNSEGKARFEGLPSKVKRPLSFEVRFGDQRKSVLHDPADNCSANLGVALGSE